MPPPVQSDAYLLPGSRRGALLLHGFTASPTETRPLGEFLHRRGMTVLGVRLAGHGTTPEDLSRTSWLDWYRSAEEGFLRLEKAVDDLFVGGVSLGGILAALLAADHPGRVTAVSLLAPAFFLKNRFFFLTPLVARFCAGVPKGADSRAYYQQHDLFSYTMRPSRSLAELRRAMRVGYRRLPEVKVPTQVIMGRKDRIVNPASGGRILDRTSSTRKELRLAENSGHILTVEPDAQEVFEWVWQFFEKR